MTMPYFENYTCPYCHTLTLRHIGFNDGEEPICPACHNDIKKADSIKRNDFLRFIGVIVFIMVIFLLGVFI